MATAGGTSGHIGFCSKILNLMLSFHDRISDV